MFALLIINQGRHHIRWAIMPHASPLDHNIVRAAQNFNNPLKIYSLSPKQIPSTDSQSLASTSQTLFPLRLEGSPALVLDCIKRGEDDEDVSRGFLPTRKGRSIIVRVYESLGGRARGSLSFGYLKVKKVWKCNLLEDDGEEVEMEDGAIKIDLKAFEVGTWRLQL